MTAFGTLWALATFVGCAWRRDAILVLLPVSAVFQAPAVVTVPFGSTIYGITPFQFTTAISLLHCTALLVQRRRLLPIPTAVRSATVLWLVFLLWSVASAFLLPRLFEGVMLHPLLSRETTHEPPVPLAWSVSNLAQAANALGMAGLLVYVLQFEAALAARRLTFGLALALAATLAVGAWQRLAYLGVASVDTAFWGSNPGYNQYFMLTDYGPEFGRVGLPFAEPSYASVWFAAVASGALVAAIFSIRHRIRWLSLLAASVAGLLNTFGTSGLLGFGAFMVALLTCVLLPWPLQAPVAMRRTALALFAVAGLSAAFAVYQVAWGTAAWLEPMRSGVSWTLYKFTDHFTEYRTSAIRQGFHVLAHSFGLGAGAGSTRASSYVVTLLANLGVPGLALFAFACHAQLRALCGAAYRVELIPLFAAGSAAGLLLGISVGISDLNWPPVWVILFWALALARLRHDEAIRPNEFT